MEKKLYTKFVQRRAVGTIVVLVHLNALRRFYSTTTFPDQPTEEAGYIFNGKFLKGPHEGCRVQQSFEST
jgi:hypothetical protein